MTSETRKLLESFKQKMIQAWTRMLMEIMRYSCRSDPKAKQEYLLTQGMLSHKAIVVRGRIRKLSWLPGTKTVKTKEEAALRGRARVYYRFSN